MNVDAHPHNLPAYASLIAAYHDAHRPELESMVRDLPLLPADRVLDVPCGDGFYTVLIADQLQAAGEVVAVDTRSEFLGEVLRRPRKHSRAAPIRAVVGNAKQLPFASDEFDFAWCAQSLISLAKPSQATCTDAVHAMSEVRRVLRPGATLAVLEHDELHHIILPWPTQLELAVQHAVRTDYERTRGASEQLEVGRHLSSMLRRAGFGSVKRLTFTIDRQWPLGDAEREFLVKRFSALRKRARCHLDPAHLDEFDRLSDWRSPRFIVDQPGFEMTCVEMVCLGIKE